jgi:membrane-anchored protein YejM (alkaline phosphatase superfamily)
VTNIVLITIDALRWDALEAAELPNIDKLISSHNAEWTKVWAQGTYTFTAHSAIFEAGHFPCNNIDKSVKPIYTRYATGRRIFRPVLPWNRAQKGIYHIPADAPNAIKGFEMLGYRTVGIGGVRWFSQTNPISRIWKDVYFNEFYYEDMFAPKCPNAFQDQIAFAKELKLKKHKPLFFFLNIPSTHNPFRGDYSLRGQRKALEYVDKHFPTLVDLLPKPYHMFLMSDHGTCIGEDRLHGHGFYHPKIMQVPMVAFHTNTRGGSNGVEKR